jgi:hypothetical protein
MEIAAIVSRRQKLQFEKCSPCLRNGEGRSLRIGYAHGSIDDRRPLATPWFVEGESGR